VVSQFEQYIKLNKKIRRKCLVSINQDRRAGRLADTSLAIFDLEISPRSRGTTRDEAVAERL